MTLFTCDVSSWDGAADWASARRAGITAVCAKATEAGIPGGYGYTNPVFGEQYDAAVAAGMPLVGAYHVLCRGQVKEQIQYFSQVVGDRKTHPGFWAMLDVERFTELTGRGLDPVFADVEEFCSEWWAAEGLPLALYLPHWVWMDFGQPDLRGLVGEVRLFASQYPHLVPFEFTALYRSAGGDSGPGWTPYGGLTPTLWQYSSTALIPGVRGGVSGADINAFRGTLAELVDQLTGTSSPTPPAQIGDDMLTHWNTIGPGATGDAVRVAQGLLLAKGLGIGATNIDGIFGPATEASVRMLQGRYGIAVDGLFGAHTLSCALYGRDLG